MTKFKTLLAAALAVGLTSAPALSEPLRRDVGRTFEPPRREEGRTFEPRRDADRAFQGVRQGRSMPLPELERRVLPFMGGADYLGPELNGDTYRFKFIQNGRVIWVDVDGQGRIIRRSHD